MSVNPKTAIEIGMGPGIVTRALRAKGVNVTTVDIDPELRPDILASVTDLPGDLRSADIVLCCQVLEHLPWHDFERLYEDLFRRAQMRIIISLPDVSPYLRFALHSQHHSIVHGHVFSLPKWTSPKRSTSCSEHCWEIGIGKVTRTTVLRALRGASGRTAKSFRLFEFPYHHFYVVDR
jgi:hypothetical protein